MLRRFGYHTNSRVKSYRKYFGLLFLAVLATACGKKDQPGKKDVRDYDFSSVETEKKTIYRSFHSDSGFNFSQSSLKQIDELLKDARAAGETNVEFLIISNRPVTVEEQQKVKDQLIPLMYGRKFIKSRIVYRGVCAYKTAKKGVRIGIIRYTVNEPDTDLWTDSIGDINSGKNIPKYGVSQTYNLEAMIDNKADLVEAREYPGMRAEAAVSALSASGEGRDSGGGDSSGSSSSSSSSSGS